MNHFWIRLLIVCGAQMLFELGKEFNTVGAANLRNYGWTEWLILLVGVLGTVALTVKACFDPGPDKKTP